MRQSAKDTPVNREGWWTREHALTLVLVAATILLLFLCWQLVLPFFSPLAWALALAIVALPFHRWIERRLSKKPGLAAGLSVFAVALMIVAPAVFVGSSIVQEATSGMQALQQGLKEEKWREAVKSSPQLSWALNTFEQHGSLGEQAQGMAAEIGKKITGLLSGSAWAIVELLLTLFVLFYFLRDRAKARATLRSLVPLSAPETTKVFSRVADTIHATVFGTLVVAAIQGVLGGLMFWWLGLPAPVLWGAVMALLAIVPVLGTFVIWLPAAALLAASGQWGKAAILTAWGGLVVALIDNLLYPILVGKKLRLHTVPVFFSILGGLAVFGASGLILGPVILALTDAILEIWRRRTADGRPAEATPVGDLENNRPSTHAST